MSLQDLNEAVVGLWDGGVAASGNALVSSGDRDGVTRQDRVVHAIAVDQQTATSVRRWCGLGSTADDPLPALPFSKLTRGGPLVRSTTALDALVLVVSSDWMPPTWVCVASLQDILTSHGPNSESDDSARTAKDRTAHPGVHIDSPVLEWRKFFSTLLHLVDTCAMRVHDVDEKGGTAMLQFPDLHCHVRLRRVWAGEEAQRLVLWSSSQLARALSFRANATVALERQLASTNRQLERVTAELTSLARDCGRAVPLSAQAALSGEQGVTAKDGGANTGPANLVNPQARAGVKRGRGMRIQ